MIELQPGVQSRAVALPDWLEQARAHAAAGYSYFDWLSAVDETRARGDGTVADEAEGADDPGIAVVLHLMAVGGEGVRPRPLPRVLLRTLVPDGAVIASLTPVFAGAAWHERETHEMFGLEFTGFDDGTPGGLRPLLLPPGFEGRPLRKSFVLAARASKPWPGAKEPGESAAPGPAGEAAPAPRRATRRRKKLLPPGVPDESWGPRPPG